MGYCNPTCTQIVQLSTSSSSVTEERQSKTGARAKGNPDLASTLIIPCIARSNTPNNSAKRWISSDNSNGLPLQMNVRKQNT